MTILQNPVPSLGNTYFRINDITFDVSANSITVDNRGQLFTWDTPLRSRNATKIKTGAGDVVIGVRIHVFPHEISKLHRLIVEFKNTPFWEIENRLLRQSIEPGLRSEQNMAFAAEQMYISSIPEHPDNWTVTLSLKWFNYLPYVSNFRFKRDLIVNTGNNVYKTIYDIPVILDPEEEAPTCTTEEQPSEDKTYSQSVSADSLMYQLKSTTLETGDLNPPFYDHESTSDVDAQDSNIYKLYINKIQNNELVSLDLSGSDIYEGKVLTITEEISPVEYPPSTYGVGSDSVIFKWKEFVRITQSTDVIDLINAANQAFSVLTPPIPENVSPLVVDPSTDNPGAKYIWPTYGTFTSPFGYRKPPKTTTGYGSSNHEGADIANATGTPITSPTYGKVIKASTQTQDPNGSNNGNNVQVQDLANPGLVHQFLHLNSFNVRIGDILKPGDYVGEMGTTGNSSGPHLHWIVYENWVPIDPMPKATPQGTQAAREIIAKYSGVLNTTTSAQSSVGLDNSLALATEITLGGAALDQYGFPLESDGTEDPYGQSFPDEVPSATASVNPAVISSIQSKLQQIQFTDPDDLLNLFTEEDLTTLLGLDGISNYYDAGKISQILQSVADQKRTLTAEGWKQYPSPHMPGIIYFRNKSLVVKRASVLDTERTVCTSMGTSHQNRIACIPLASHQYKTCQSLGGYDSQLNLSFLSLTHMLERDGVSSQTQEIMHMLSTLEYNAREFRAIPDSWTLDIDSVITRLSGHLTYVADRARVTTTDIPGLSAFDISFYSSLKKPEEKLIRNFTYNKEQAITEIAKRLSKYLIVTIGEGRVHSDHSGFPLEEAVPEVEHLYVQKFDPGGIPETGKMLIPLTDLQSYLAKGYVATSDPRVWVSGTKNLGPKRKVQGVEGEPIILGSQYILSKEVAEDVYKGLLFNVVPLATGAFREREAYEVSIEGLQYKDNIEETLNVPNLYFIRYETPLYASSPESDIFPGFETDPFLKARILELGTLIELCSKVLSDKHDGGYSRSELLGKLSIYGLERFVLPCYGREEAVLNDISNIANSEDGSTFSEANVLATIGSLQTKGLTLKKFYAQNGNTSGVVAKVGVTGTVGTLFLTLVAGPPGFVLGAATALSGVALATAGGVVTGDVQDDPVLNSLVGTMDSANQTINPKVGDDNTESSVTQSTNPDEDALIKTLKDLIDQYFNTVWFSGGAFGDAKQHPEFKDIYENIGTELLKTASECYPDIDLPDHPFYNSNLYTNPDFYIFSPGLDNGIEGNPLENKYLQAQVDSVLSSSFETIQNLEQGSLQKTFLTSHLWDQHSGCLFDGSDTHAKGKKGYRSRLEYEKVSKDLVAQGGHLPLRNNAGFLDLNDTLDHSFSLDGLKAIAKESLLDFQPLKGTIRRAFPTFKLFFIEDDSDENWRAFDDFYSYTAVKNITLTRSYKVPADLLIIELQNVSGILDGTLFGSISDIDHLFIDDPEGQKLHTGKSSFSSEQNKITESKRPGAAETQREDFVSALVLREGMNIQLRLGYSNNPNLLSTVFNGRVAEVAWTDNSDEVRIICQNYAVELVQIEKGITDTDIDGDTPDTHITLSSAVGYSNTAELLSTLIKSPEITHFGRWKLGAYSQSDEVVAPESDSKFYIGANLGLLDSVRILGSSISANSQINATSDLPLEGRSSLVYGTNSFLNNKITEWFGTDNSVELQNLVDQGISIKQFLQLRWKTLRNNPSDDNIYAPHPDDMVDYGLFDTTGKINKEQIVYRLLSTTVWDVFQEMTYRHPGWIASPVPYGDRMTMFFGVPSQRYWAVDADDGFVKKVEEYKKQLEADDLANRPVDGKVLSNYLDALKLRFRPFRKYHLVTSATDIVSNEISTSTYGVSNTVSVFYNPSGSEGGAATQPSFLGVLGNMALTPLQPLWGSFKGGYETATFNLKTLFAEGFTVGSIEKLFTNTALSNPLTSSVTQAGGHVLDTAAMAKRWLEGSSKSTFVMKYHPLLDDDKVYLSTVEFENCNGEEMALRYGMTAMGNGLKEMYKGSITLLGSPSIKPYDVLILMDTYNGISGPVEVEEVTHIFSPDTGFISVIIPKAVVIMNETSTSPLIDAMKWVAMHKAEQIYKSTGGLTAGVMAATTSASVVLSPGAPATTAGAATGAATSTFGMAGLIGGWAYITRIADKPPVIILPLLNNGRPMIAGIPDGIPETRWEVYKGKWRRWLGTEEKGYIEWLRDSATMGFDVVRAYGDDMSLLEKGVIMAVGPNK